MLSKEKKTPANIRELKNLIEKFKIKLSKSSRQHTSGVCPKTGVYLRLELSLFHASRDVKEAAESVSLGVMGGNQRQVAQRGSPKELVDIEKGSKD